MFDSHDSQRLTIKQEERGDDAPWPLFGSCITNWSTGHPTQFVCINTPTFPPLSSLNTCLRYFKFSSPDQRKTRSWSSILHKWMSSSSLNVHVWGTCLLWDHLGDHTPCCYRPGPPHQVLPLLYLLLFVHLGWSQMNLTVKYWADILTNQSRKSTDVKKN